MTTNFKSVRRQLRRGNLKAEVKTGADGKQYIQLMRRIQHWQFGRQYQPY